MRWDEGSLRGTTRLKTLSACRKSSPSAIFSDGELRRPPTSPPARRAADGVRNVCAFGANSPPAQQSRAIRLQLGGPAGPPNLPGRGRSERENAFSTFVCAGYRGRAVGDWPRERRDGGAPGSVTALAAGEAALLARDRGARAVLARFRRGAGNGGILPQTAGVCNGEMRLRAACLPLQKNCASFPKND